MHPLATARSSRRLQGSLPVLVLLAALGGPARAQEPQLPSLSSAGPAQESGDASGTTVDWAAVAGQDAGQDAAQDAATEEPKSWFEAMHLTPEEGIVDVGEDLARIDLPEGWHLLRGDQAHEFVEKFWGNPPDDELLGVVLPPSEADEVPSWAVVVDYEDSGHVADDDASSIDYDELLRQIQKNDVAADEARRKLGFGTVRLLGWADPPHYDAEGHKLYWAKDLQFEGEEGETLNYEVRVLGRRGVLSLNAVAGIEELPAVRAGSQALLASTQFLYDNRYKDYDSSLDHLAAYGIGGLIAGKVLAKVGLFKMLGLSFAKFWKAIAVGLAAVASVFRRLFRRRRAPAA